MSNPQINISNTGSATGNRNIISDTTISDETINEDITFTFSDGDGDVTSMFDLPEAHINIFDSEYYIAHNPDVAESLTSEYANAGTSISVANVDLPKLGIGVSNFDRIPTGENPISIVDGEIVVNDEIFANRNALRHSVALEDYVTSGAVERQNPSPLFDNQYYLEQNPDVAAALAGGSFNGDPLLHYVESGAAEGRDPNPFFDSDYYLAQNPYAALNVQLNDSNPLEHYVLLGSLEGADPSANFDPQFYLAQNQDVAAAGIDPLTHFLTFGQDEGRLPIAE